MNGFQLLTTELSTRVCVTLLHSLWQVAALAALAGLAGHVWRKRPAAWAYAAHVSALMLSVACLPVTFVLTGSVPALFDATDATHAKQPAVAVKQPADSTASMQLPSSAVEPIAADPKQVGQVAEVPQSAEKVAVGINWGSAWSRIATGLVGIYAAGVVLMLVRLAIGIGCAEGLRCRSRLVTDGPLFDALRCLADAWSMRVVPALATAEDIAIPKVVGLVKPTILMPVSAISGLSPHQLEMILAHELAHVRRYDMWINLVQRLTEAVLFFNPTLWLLSRRIGSLREYCCDELACGRTHERGDESHLLYAQALLRIVELSQRTSRNQPNLAALQASGQFPSELRRRVERLLGEPVRESLQLSRSALFPLSLVAAMIVAQPVLNTLAQSGSPSTEGVAVETSSEQDASEPVSSGDAVDSPPAAVAEQAISADRSVAEARARTFGLQSLEKIAFKHTYRQADELAVPDDAQDDLASLWKARASKVADAQLDRNRHEMLLAWDGDQLLLESFTGIQPEHSWRQTRYWDGQQGWIGETRGNNVASRNVYRYGALDKLIEHIMPFGYPHWAAAGDRLPWSGPTVLLEEHGVSPTHASYRLAGSDTIDGALCDIYDGPERHEKVWVERATKLVKAVSRHYVSDISHEESWNIIREAAGRKFDDQQGYEQWFKNLSAEQMSAFQARWSAATWKLARPGNLTVFSDYREVAPGVQWPHEVDRVVVHRNGQGKGGSKYYLSKILVEQIRDFEIAELAANALPETGVKVTDRTGDAPFEYVWTDELNDAEVERLREDTLAELRAEEEKTRQINATPIESVDDAIRILTEGPKTDPTKVWARAIKYLSDHPEQALPALIDALDSEDRDHPVSKLAFALRAVGDARAVPALIRALPRTLQPSRSDYGLLLDDDELRHFMQQHDLGDGVGDSFDYGRAFREVAGALRRLTGQQFNEMELNWISLRGNELQNRLARQHFDRVAGRWADWWEANWQTHVDDPAYASVNLRNSITPKRSRVVATKPPSGPGVELIGVGTGGIIQSVHDTGKACFFDLDTKRQAGWPDELPALGKIRLDSPEVLDWARREGFDLVGITYTPAGEAKPLYCLMPLDLRAWQITEEEHRGLGEMVRGARPYPLTRPVDLLIPHRTVPKPRDPKHSGDSFLFVTREGTAGVLRLTAQVTKAKDITGYASSDEDIFRDVGFFRGVKYALAMMSAPAVTDPEPDTDEESRVDSMEDF